MAEFIITTLKFRIRDPNWHAVLLRNRPSIDISSDRFPKFVCINSKGADPKLSPEPVSYTLHCIFETTVTARVALKVPRLGFGFGRGVA